MLCLVGSTCSVRTVVTEIQLRAMESMERCGLRVSSRPLNLEGSRSRRLRLIWEAARVSDPGRASWADRRRMCYTRGVREAVGGALVVRCEGDVKWRVPP